MVRHDLLSANSYDLGEWNQNEIMQSREKNNFFSLFTLQDVFPQFNKKSPYLASSTCVRHKAQVYERRKWNDTIELLPSVCSYLMVRVNEFFLMEIY